MVVGGILMSTHMSFIKGLQALVPTATLQHGIDP